MSCICPLGDQVLLSRRGQKARSEVLRYTFEREDTVALRGTTALRIPVGARRTKLAP